MHLSDHDFWSNECQGRSGKLGRCSLRAGLFRVSFFKLPQKRHPERSASEIYIVKKRTMARSRRTPGIDYPSDAVRTLSTTEARACWSIEKCTRHYLCVLKGEPCSRDLVVESSVNHRPDRHPRGPSTPRHSALSCDNSATRFAQNDDFVLSSRCKSATAPARSTIVSECPATNKRS